VNRPGIGRFHRRRHYAMAVPVTSNNLPRAAAPTGTFDGVNGIGDFGARARPSVGARERQRTQLLPIWSCTSRINFPLPVINFQRVKYPRNSSGETQHRMTVPMI